MKGCSSKNGFLLFLFFYFVLFLLGVAVCVWVHACAEVHKWLSGQLVESVLSFVGFKG